MKSSSEIAVTLSDELFDQLRSQARRLRVPLKWLVASLVCAGLIWRRLQRVLPVNAVPVNPGQNASPPSAAPA